MAPNTVDPEGDSPVATLYTWGYSQGTQAQLVALARECNAIVVDARSVPRTRVKGFGTRQLAIALGGRYQWRGGSLGGRAPGVTVDGLAWVEAQLRAGQSLLILCMEHAPASCHRHHTIALPLARKGVEALHIFMDDGRGELIEAKELQRAIDADDSYECMTFEIEGM